MKIFIIIMVVIVFIAVLTLTICVSTDKILMQKKIKEMKVGMTGHQLQEAAKIKLKFLSMSGDYYYAKVISPMHFFKYNLVFKNGRLKEVERI